MLELVPADVVLKSGRHIPDSDAAAAEMSLVRWQPDFIAISYTSKKIAIGPEVCQPSDTRAENLVEAYHRKIPAYQPIMNKLFLPTSRKVLPTFRTFCPDGVHFAQTVVHFAHIQNQARKRGVLGWGWGCFVFVHIPERAL